MNKPPPDPLFVLRAHTANVTALHFISDAFEFMKVSGPALISGSKCGEIFIWNLKINRVQFKLSGHDGKMIMWLNYSQKHVLSQGKSDVINIWKHVDNEWLTIRKISTPNVGFCPVSLFNNKLKQHLIVPDSEANAFHLVDYKTGDMLSKISLPAQGMCMFCKVYEWKNEKVVVCGYESGTILAWNIESDSIVSSLNCHNDPVFCFDIDLNHQQRGISGSVDNVLKTWNIDDNFQLSIGPQLTLKSSGVNCVSIRPDGKIMIAGCWDGNLRIFSWKSLKPLAVLNFHRSSMLCLEFCNACIGKYKSVFATGAQDSNIAIWTIY